MSSAQRSGVPPPGIWCPAVTFFDPATDSLDLDSQAKYYSYLSRIGLAGLVVLGTNGETFLLTREERKSLIETARGAVGPDFPLMAGCSGHSVKQVLEFVGDAASAGATSALILPAAYFGTAATTPSVVARFYDRVAAQSPLPIVLYNFPAVCNGVDLDSDTIAAIARSHANVVGVKLTCAQVGKITRLAGQFAPHEFAVFGGQSDFLIGGMSVGSAGCIAAFANVFPKTIVRIYNLYRAGKHAEALELHRAAAHAESPCKSGIATTKYAASIFSAKAAGIEDEEKLQPRAPYEPPTDAIKKKVREVMSAVAEIEASL